MTYTEIRNTGSFSFVLNAESSTEILTVLDIGALTARYAGLNTDYYSGSEFLLESLHLTINFDELNLGISPVPDIAPEDTQAERQAKIAVIQREYPKIGLSFFKSVSPGAFKRQSMAVLQNPGYEWYLPVLIPYLTMSEVKLLGPEDKLGIQIVDLGNGILSGASSLVLEGSWRQVVTLTKKMSQRVVTQTFGSDIYPGPGGLILPGNSLRRLLWISNPGTLRVWIGFKTPVTANSSLYLDPGNSLNLESLELYIGEPLYAKTEAGTGRLVGLEGILEE